MDLELTHPNPEDVAPLLLALHAAHADALPERFHHDGTLADMVAHLASHCASGAVLLGAGVEARLVGYVLYVPTERPRDAFRVAQKTACLDHLYVAPRFRKRGIATRMIREMEAQLRAQGVRDWYATHHAFNKDVAQVFAAAGATPRVHMVGRSF